MSILQAPQMTNKRCFVGGEMHMKLSNLIDILSESLSLNGEMNVVGIVDGKIYNSIEINCPDEDSPMYIELYAEVNK